MKVLVYDVAAESGGALSVLKEFYEKAVSDVDTEWVFILSVVKLSSKDNIKVENYPEVKKSWIKRYFFDKFTAPKIIKKHSPDVVLNLQNITVRTKSKQILYMQQSLPFSPFRFTLAHKKLWVIQNVLGGMIKRSCKKADEIIVQSEWIRKAVSEQCKVPEERIVVKSPKVDKSKLRLFEAEKCKGFFYPAAGSFYKNHTVVARACTLLKEQGYDYGEVVFTLRGDETEEIREIYERSREKGLNITWKGEMTREEVFRTYAEYALIFPSFIETFGLPLLEARESGAPVLAADTPFAREILANYEKAEFFPYDNPEILAEKIKTLKEKI